MKFTEAPILLAFLEETPFDTFAQHSVGRTKQSTYVCLQSPRIEDSCPLCELTQNRATNIFAFNVAVLSDLKNSGPSSAHVLFAEGHLTLSLTRSTRRSGSKKSIADGYWSISVRNIQSKLDYLVSHVGAGDLKELWNLDPIQVEASLKNIQLFDYSIVEVAPREELLEIAKNLLPNSDRLANL